MARRRVGKPSGASAGCPKYSAAPPAPQQNTAIGGKRGAVTEVVLATLFEGSCRVHINPHEPTRKESRRTRAVARTVLAISTPTSSAMASRWVGSTLSSTISLKASTTPPSGWQYKRGSGVRQEFQKRCKTIFLLLLSLAYVGIYGSSRFVSGSSASRF